MKKVLSLTESELIKVINRIVESYNDDAYNDEDYVEVFFNYFRPWVRKNHGDEIGEYPLSYLAKKYMSEFAKDNGMNPDNVIFSYRTNLANAANVGKAMVGQGKHKLPSLRSQEKFTEKFKNPLTVLFINYNKFGYSHFKRKTFSILEKKLMAYKDDVIEKICIEIEYKKILKKNILKFKMFNFK
jgi:hypothetical protein